MKARLAAWTAMAAIIAFGASIYLTSSPFASGHSENDGAQEDAPIKAASFDTEKLQQLAEASCECARAGEIIEAKTRACWADYPKGYRRPRHIHRGYGLHPDLNRIRLYCDRRRQEMRLGELRL